ncbi:MAG: T9SS type A sorting domain-containing protein [bacterium]|nr:T9SS type A sorting domain-containing protein [bacterium]
MGAFGGVAGIAADHNATGDSDGDTLLFAALNVGTEVSDTILVCSSFDNGQTFTPWIHASDGSSFVSAQFAGSAGRFYACFSEGTILPRETWLRISLDGGLTWSAMRQYRTNTYALRGFACGNRVFAAYRGYVNNDPSTCGFGSNNGGQDWSARVTIDTAYFYLLYFDQSIAFTQAHTLLIEEPVPSVNPDLRLYVARGDSVGQNWTTFQVLPCQHYDEYGCQYIATIVGDTASESAGVLGIFGDWDASAPMTPLHYRTQNVATGWEDCVLMGPPRIIPALGSTLVPANVCAGKLWLVGWEHLSGSGWNYLGARFSANHGKNWYPLQVAADSLVEAWQFSGQIRGNRIDIYWDQYTISQDRHDYRMVRGVITPDTMLPVLSTGSAPPETVRVGRQVEFSIVATDNDTLSEVRLMVVAPSGDTLRFGMPRGADHLFQFTWEVPDSGFYPYWYAAEDFWENVATLPDSGSFHFVAEGSSASDDFILHPSSFSLSVFPNPCNTWPSLTLSPEWFVLGPVEITVFNALGQEVIHQVTTGTPVPFSPDVPAASGTYLLQVSNRVHSAMQKFVVLK